MQEMLRSAFGEWGAVVAQFLITVVVVLALIALVYWMVRRYSGIRLGGIGRGRVPRLAVVDAMAIDSRRQLVLIRRDNVEHLILIGGPADIVVEPSIQRPRARPAQPVAQPAANGAGAAHQHPQAAAASQPPEPAAPPAPQRPGEPIPFPPQRMHQPRPAAGSDRVTLRPLHRPAAPPEPLPPLPPVQSEPEPPPPWATAADASAPFRPITAGEAGPEQEALLPEIAAAEIAEPQPPQLATAEEQPAAPVSAEAAAEAEATDESRQPALDLGEGGAPATDLAEPQPLPDEETKSRVSDLEREMARLLGEITAKRSS